ncbi:iron transporter [Lachnospiraceae bacterium WCA3-601-WT-6H]|uniref:Iron transporter n=2 Tax=Waltera intestinalis TaxID=2606635 RepID=A0A6L5YES7_9FIRM|nr:iron transporter [Waltera intestinalis]
MKAKTLMNKIIIVGGLSACLLLGGCGAGQAADATSAESTVVAQESTAAQAESAEAIAGTTEAAATETAQNEAQLPDGVYTAEFSTDSSMFHVSEACDGKETLTVKDGVMTIHISLGSKKILNLYPGLAEDAAKDGAVLLEPTTDTVTYSDGMTEEVYGFDVPVPVIGEEFNLALIGTKGKWYDHKVKVSDPVAEGAADTFDLSAVEDGSYTIELTMEGGSGRASIQSPAQLAIADGAATAILEWSSPNYDYMLVNGEKYLPVNTEGNSVFEVPVEALDAPLTMIGDTVAMSTPHEVEYTVTFHSETLESAESGK